MSTKVKQWILFIATLVVGIAIGSYITMYVIGNFTEYGSIVNSVAQVKINYWTLNDLQTGNINDAIERLELVSKSNIDYLKSCDSVTCEKIESNSIKEAISLFEKYESNK